MNEFINPKSMLTPGMAGGTVAFISGALFKTFGLSMAHALLFFSFLVGTIVFFHKDLASVKFKKLEKLVFYVLNSFIIFAMATSTHSMLEFQAPSDQDPQPAAESQPSSSASAGVSLFRVVYAQVGPSLEEAPLIEQRRPFFFDWTKEDLGLGGAGSDNKLIEVTVCRDFGSITDYLADLGLIRPSYNVTVRLDPQVSSDGTSVTWRAPAAYFDRDEVSTGNQSNGFELNLRAWKPFEIGAEMALTQEPNRSFQRVIAFHNAMECS